jgi:alpha-tubulin suppressor-like RCC1 family protein
MAVYRIVLRNNKIAYEVASPYLIYLTETSGVTNSFVNIVAGYYNSAGIDIYNRVWTWGEGSYGQIGNNNIVAKCVPTAVCGNHTFCKIETGTNSLGINFSGKAWAWGYNLSGQLGDNTVVSKRTPIAVCGNHTFCDIKRGGYTETAGDGFHSMGLGYNGKVWCWGNNIYGENGDNSITCRSTPVAVCGGHTFCQICCGQRHSLAIDNHGKAWAWGHNGFGAIGNNAGVDKSTPVAVCGGHTFCLISCGHHHSLAVDNHGKAWAWGSNGSFGNLGDNTVVNKSTPIAVCGGHTFCQIAGGSYFSSALDNHGKEWSWGDNGIGQLGNNTTVSKSTPIAVYGTHTFCDISNGFYHSLGLDNNGIAWAWGENSYGQLGNNTYGEPTFKSTPVAVIF